MHIVICLVFILICEPICVAGEIWKSAEDSFFLTIPDGWRQATNASELAIPQIAAIFQAPWQGIALGVSDDSAKALQDLYGDETILFPYVKVAIMDYEMPEITAWSIVKSKVFIDTFLYSANATTGKEFRFVRANDETQVLTILSKPYDVDTIEYSQGKIVDFTHVCYGMNKLAFVYCYQYDSALTQSQPTLMAIASGMGFNSTYRLAPDIKPIPWYISIFSGVIGLITKGALLVLLGFFFKNQLFPWIKSFIPR